MDEFEEYKEEQWIQHGYLERYLSAIKRRLNLQIIGSFIHDRDDCDSFRKREDDVYTKFENKLIAKYGKEETDEMMPLFNAYLSVEQEVHFNLGMKTDG